MKKLWQAYVDAGLPQPDSAVLSKLEAALQAEHVPIPNSEAQEALLQRLKADQARLRPQAGTLSFRRQMLASRRSARYPGVVPARLAPLFAMVVPQMRLLSMSFWLATAVIMFLGGLLTSPALFERYHIAPLFIVAPLLAALGVAFAFRSYNSRVAAWEQSCPITPMQLVIGRLSVVVAYDIILGMISSLFTAWQGLPAPLVMIICAWLLPLIAFAAILLLFTIHLDSKSAAAIGVLIWLAFTLVTHGGSALLSLSLKSLAMALAPTIGLAVYSCRLAAARIKRWSMLQYAS
ncbi:MAG TPA: hypothetical protein GXX29_10510 [Firmicutes bacterium]|nr:hypothetical protein [Bacillota bacterium]